MWRCVRPWPGRGRSPWLSGGPRPAGFASQPAPPGWIAEMRRCSDHDKQYTVSYEIDFYNEERFRPTKFTFDPKVWDAIDMPQAVKDKLCLNDPDHEYVLIGEGFTFPDNNDNPVVNSPSVPASFYWDPASPTPKMLIQIGPHFPPALWLPAKPDYPALKRIFSEFLTTDAHMMKKHMLYFEGLQRQMEERAGTTLAKIQPERMRDLIVDDRRRVDPASIGLDWERTSRLYLGVVDHYQQAEASFMNNPFLFAWPMMLGHENHHQLESLAKTSIFRTVYSKSMLIVEGREDLQVDPTAPAEQQCAFHVPLFATVNYPANQRMCGGAALVRRWNALFGSEHALDTPVDVLAACIGNLMAGPASLLANVEQFTKALGSGTLSPRERNECASSIAMLIAHLAVLRAPTWKTDILERFCFSDVPAIRIACAKGAVELGLRAELQSVARQEPDPRVRQIMDFLLAQ
eukprot:EG_transcript_11845